MTKESSATASVPSNASGGVSPRVETTYPDYDYLLKILLIGDSNTGKSSLLMRFCDDTFSEAFISTIGVDFKVKTIEMDGKLVKLQIWDSAGQERFRTLTSAYYRGAHGIIMVYDISDATSFLNIESWSKEVQDKASTNVVKLLVGNKCDRNCVEVEYKAAKEYADEKGLHLVEASAKYGINVDKIFTDVVQEIHKSGSIVLGEKVTPKVSQSSIVLQGTEVKKNRLSECCGAYL